MGKIKALVVAAVLAFVTFGFAPSANAHTCAISDDVVEDVLCGAYGTLGPVYQALCNSKFKFCFA